MTAETQIVVIGGGGAGLSAATAAAEMGADVIVLEKRQTLGGNSALAEGLFAAESPAQKRLNIDARRDEAFKIAMSYAHWTLDARLVRAFIDKSGDTIHWLENKGMYFDWIPPYYHDQPVRTWHCIRGRGIVLVKLLAGICEGRGVRFFYEYRAKTLLTDRKGKVCGVIAVTNGKEVEILARSVVISTGGYGGNKELLKRYCPYYTDHLVYRGVPNQGDGLLMATEIGAATEGLGILQLSGHTSPKLSLHINAVTEEPNTVWVNKRGERFIDEAAGFNHYESVNAVLRQPGRLCYTLFDESIKQNIVENGIIKGVGQIVPPGTRLVDLEQDLQVAAVKDPEWIKIANCWDDIATWMGAEPGILRATISEYNSFCDQGHDAVFAKDARYLQALFTPPYYALKCYPSFLGTIGGIRINYRMEVLDHQYKTIPGLYAAGSDTGGWESDTYNVVLSGSTLGFAINSGRIAGENAARFVSQVER